MEEMNWRQTPLDVPPLPAGSVVPLLLLLAWLAPGPGRCCIFPFDPLSTTFPEHIRQLTQHLLLDYPVSVPANLEPDGWCAELWTIHFLAAELGRMWGAAGTELAPLVRNVARQASFAKECNISDPEGCVGLELANVSQMLSALSRHMAALKSKMPGRGGQEGPADFSNCTSVRCQPGPLAPLPTQASLLQPGSSGRKQPRTQASGAGSLHRSHLLVFLVLVPILGYLGFVSLWTQRRLRGQGTQASEQSDPCPDGARELIGKRGLRISGAVRAGPAATDPGTPGAGGAPRAGRSAPPGRAKRRVESATPPARLN